MEQLKDILGGLGQRVVIYKSKLLELQKKREKVDDEVKTVKKYLELAETLYRVEEDKAGLSDLSNQKISQNDKERTSKFPFTSIPDVTDQSREILLGKTKYVGLSVPQAAFLLLKKEKKAMHAKNIYQKLLDGGIRMRGKTPVTSIAISLKRDKRFRKIAPNTFEIVGEKILQSDSFHEGAKA